MLAPVDDAPASPAAGPDALRAFRLGAGSIVPILLGVVPFGLIAGLAATRAGLGLAEASGFSVVVFAGAAQLAALDLLGSGAPLAVVVATALVINLRFAMYSASLAPHLAGASLPRRLVAAYVMTDQSYAVSIVRFARDEMDGPARLAFYLGTATPMWLTWQVCTVVGAVAGGVVPPGLPLGFAVALAFLSLLLPAVTDRPTLAAAATAAVVAVLAVGLPAGTGLPLAMTSGVAVGWLLATRRRRRVPA